MLQFWNKLSLYDKFIYILSIIIIIAIFVILITIRTINISETFSRINFSSLCGPGTIPGKNQCEPDIDSIGQNLIDNGFIQKINDQIVFTPEHNDQEIIPQPLWYQPWLENGAYSGQKVISWGMCNIPGNNCNAPCRCADCAGWRGGNKTDCNSVDIGNGRVWCNLEPGVSWTFEGEYDKCQCEYGYTAVNGLCVSPFIMDNTTPESRCCPDCVWFTEDQGGCAGSIKCDTSKKCKESKVELPGTRKYNLRPNNPNIVFKTQPCSQNQTQNCYDPQDPDVRFNQPHVIVTPNSNNPQTTAEYLLNEDTNTARNQNEYECALLCGNYQGSTPTVSSQVECSKRCLPKLWRWYPVYVVDEATQELIYTNGYYQSDELVRYIDGNNSIKYCPDNTCEAEVNIPDISEFNNCTECENCKYLYADYTNNNNFTDRTYRCEKCKQCILDQQYQHDGETYQIDCKDMVNCTTCRNHAQNLNGVPGLQFNECDSCTTPNPNNPNAGCKVYTRDPFIIRDGVFRYHPQAVEYNHGGDPINKGDAYDPYTRNSVCDYGVISGNPNCGNTIDGKQGWGDGHFFRPFDCTETCN